MTSPTHERAPETRDGLRRTPLLNVSELPDVVFGPRDIMWWGTMGFVVIEGFTLALCLVVYLYLWKNFDSWPPANTERPTLLAPTIQVAVMLLSLPLMRRLARAGREFDLDRARVLLAVATVWMAAITVLRAFELRALRVLWDTNAYGSAQWLVVVSHGTLIAIELVEIAGMAAVFWFGTVERKHFSDVADAAFYWMFLVLSWLPIYVLNYLGPRYFM
jgi:heme/copper-type cytochrome/quinol oxidase subunit 3